MRIIVIAGPNGAGKSTFAGEYLRREGAGRPFVNGDDIAAELNPDDPTAAAQEAGRIALRRMEAYVAGGTDFAVETTLSGRAYATRIRRWQERGYRVAIVYLPLPSAEYAVERVAQRVMEGGHDIPEVSFAAASIAVGRTFAACTGKLPTNGWCTTVRCVRRCSLKSRRAGREFASDALAGDQSNAGTSTRPGRRPTGGATMNRPGDQR